MVIFVKPNGATVVENDVIGLGSFVGKIAVVSPTRTGAYVTLHVAPAHGEYLKPMYCAPMISTDVEDLGIYLCDMTRSISAVAGRVRYQVSFVYEDGREEFTPEGSFTVSQGVVSIPPDDPSESMYNAIRSALIANINNYTEIVEKLDMVWEAKTLVEENLEKINESKEAAEKAANHAQNISENFDVVASDVLKEAKESGMFDGVSVTHEWDGSKLIVTSASGTSESDLRGPEGKRGETGKGFEISKTYASVLQMHADYGNPAVPLYGFVLIDTGNVEDEDNAKLYVKQESGYQYLTDLSGSQGIKGERGYSAFELAVQQGFVGGEAEWLASLKKPAEDAAKEAKAGESAREAAEQQRKAISEDVYARANAALTSASQSASRAAESEAAAKISETNANGYKNAAEAAQAAAEKARDDAQSIAGGDFASTAYVNQKAAEAEGNAKTAAQGYANTAESNANRYTNQKISEISTPDVGGKIGAHNTDTAAHNDIRLLIEGLTSRINTLANSDDTTLDQMAEVVAYIKANRDLISQITTNKVNVGDIVNDLATNVSNKPLSAAQGVALKALIDAIKIPTTLPASDVYGWAKQPSKPTYSASEVGARPDNWTPYYNEVKNLPVIPSGVSAVEHQYAVSNSKDSISTVETWSGITSSLSQRERSCIFANGYYVVCGAGGEVGYSKDGVTWTKITPFYSKTLTNIAYGKGKFIIVDEDNGLWMAEETPISWSKIDVTFSSGIGSLTYANNRFVIAGANMCAFSEDGVKWTEVEAPGSYNQISFGGGRYVAVGAGGAVGVSYDGVTWVDRSNPAVTGDLRGVVFAKGRYIIGGIDGVIIYTEDFVTWGMATSNSTVRYVRQITYAENVYYAACYTSAGGGEIWKSLDGITWTVQQQMNTRLWCLAYNAGQLITAGDSGAVYILDLGIDWQTKQADLAEGQYLWERVVFTLSDGGQVVGDGVFVKSPMTTAGIIGVADTDYSTPKARASSLHSTDTTPLLNGAICWTYK